MKKCLRLPGLVLSAVDINDSQCLQGFYNDIGTGGQPDTFCQQLLHIFPDTVKGGKADRGILIIFQLSIDRKLWKIRGNFLIQILTVRQHLIYLIKSHGLKPRQISGHVTIYQISRSATKSGSHQGTVLSENFLYIRFQGILCSSPGVCSKYQPISFPLVILTQGLCQNAKRFCLFPGNLFGDSKLCILRGQKTIMPVQRQSGAYDGILRLYRILCDLHEQLIPLTEFLLF